MAINNTYDPNGTLNSTMDLRGVDIGKMPNFYGDLNEMVRRLRPLPVAGQQAQALRSAPPPQPMPPMRREPMPDPMKPFRDQAEMAQLQAQYLTPGQLGILNPDKTYGDQFLDKRMTGAQRGVFLPKEAGMANQGVSTSAPSGISPQRFASWTEGDSVQRERDDAANMRDPQGENARKNRERSRR